MSWYVNPEIWKRVYLFPWCAEATSPEVVQTAGPQTCVAHSPCKPTAWHFHIPVSIRITNSRWPFKPSSLRLLRLLLPEFMLIYSNQLHTSEHTQKLFRPSFLTLDKKHSHFTRTSSSSSHRARALLQTLFLHQLSLLSWLMILKTTRVHLVGFVR